MLDRIPPVGINADGLLYVGVNPRPGELVDRGISDSRGYVHDAYHTVYMVDGATADRDAIVRPRSALDTRYRDYGWERPSAERVLPGGRLEPGVSEQW
jgi:hypothetical protein